MKRPGTTFVTTAAVAAVVAVVVVVSLVELSSSGRVKSQLGSPTFVAGYARTLAPQVATQGPLLFASLAGHNRPVFLQHIGTDEKQGWVAILALAPGQPPTCVLRWNGTGFTDPCTHATYPADGTGLSRFATTVLRSDRVDVNLRAPLP